MNQRPSESESDTLSTELHAHNTLNKMPVNLKKLNQQLYYHPPWQEDKPIFLAFLQKSSFSNQDIILFARLYVKYSHLHCSKSNELANYFSYILKKMQINDSNNLFSKTHNIYQNLKH